jgi:hypothetical protein
MKVYVVFYRYNGDTGNNWHISHIFSTRELAEGYVKADEQRNEFRATPVKRVLYDIKEKTVHDTEILEK